MYVYASHGLVPSESTKKVLDPQELELQMVVSHSEGPLEEPQAFLTASHLASL